MAYNRKETDYEQRLQQAELYKKQLEIRKVEQEIRVLEREEKRKETKELREIEDQQMKRQEESRKQSADMREELVLWLKCLMGVFAFSVTLIQFSSLFSTLLERIAFYGMITLCTVVIIVFTIRLVVKSVKRLGKR